MLSAITLRDLITARAARVTLEMEHYALVIIKRPFHASLDKGHFKKLIKE